MPRQLSILKNSRIKFKQLTCGYREVRKLVLKLLQMEGTSTTITGRSPILVGMSPTKEFTNVKIPRDRPFRVAVEGNIGAGKSTLIKYFQGMEGIETYAEPIDCWRNVEGHNLLDLMYSDIHEWLRVFQNYVQLTRLSIQTTKPKSPSTRVQMFERSIQNNRFCFMEQAYKNGYLPELDYVVLDEWYRWIKDNIDISLDLIVYLRSTPEVVYERVKQRGRPEESDLTLEYLQQLHASHEQWLMSGDEKLNTIPVLEMDADKTLDEIIEVYKENEKRILGYEKIGMMKRNPAVKRKVSF